MPAKDVPYQSMNLLCAILPEGNTSNRVGRRLADLLVQDAQGRLYRVERHRIEGGHPDLVGGIDYIYCRLAGGGVVRCIDEQTYELPDGTVAHVVPDSTLRS
ncbi:hypothetical protein CS345_10415 [Bordetella bronchiseptica]|uniref:Uncharacterized protein n=4 Tax=Bordetella TaxID=517 RepID=K0MHH2_BORPB|nr:hypothetical protein [Bordetella bronchiseptica]CAE33604.1 hypothetical protein BB3112 [Bordetella bronchiseptica RB50]CCJ50180.1 conserved hypothetical protein [Bordetella parapertussis Bpp5]CCJ52832.1 hypothetical protein BN112_0914 [Bordetella bronchiseptica 253]CCN22840.1 hypothetical protein BN113_2056 [Bordetella bronchiseptica 1289]AMG89264.1 hypothetical protein AL472_17090 [Bordetella bronchiseptica]